MNSLDTEETAALMCGRPPTSRESSVRTPPEALDGAAADATPCSGDELEADDCDALAATERSACDEGCVCAVVRGVRTSVSIVIIVLFCSGTGILVSWIRAAVMKRAPSTKAAMICVAADVPKPNGRSRLYSLWESVEMGIQSVKVPKPPLGPVL